MRRKESGILRLGFKWLALLMTLTSVTLSSVKVKSTLAYPFSLPAHIFNRLCLRQEEAVWDPLSWDYLQIRFSRCLAGASYS